MKSKFDIIKYKSILFIVNILRKFQVNEKGKLSNSFFILGSGRNGSTLLSSILNAHEDLFIPPEQFILPYAIMKKYFSCFTNTEKCNNEILNMFSEKRKTLNWDVNLEKVDVQDKRIESFFNNIYITYSKQKKKIIKLWGDKTPINIHFINFIYPEFKKSKYIFLIRDARDVILSYKQLKHHKAVDTEFAIWKWNDSIKQLKFLQKNTDVLIIKYEDLVTNPIIEVNKVLVYLGLEENNELINLKSESSAMGVGEKEHHQNLNKPISSTSVGKWKEKLSVEDITLVEKRCSKIMKEFGYII